MSEKQLRLDLDDRKQFLQSKIENYWLGTDSDWYVFLVRGKLFLGIRTHDLGGTDYDYVERISLEEAEWLLQERFFHSKVPFSRESYRVYEHVDAVKRYKETHDG